VGIVKKEGLQKKRVNRQERERMYREVESNEEERLQRKGRK
jgi:hypothetical protein